MKFKFQCSLNKVSLEHSHAHSYILFKAAFTLQRQVQQLQQRPHGPHAQKIYYKKKKKDLLALYKKF